MDVAIEFAQIALMTTGGATVGYHVASLALWLPKRARKTRPDLEGYAIAAGVILFTSACMLMASIFNGGCIK